MVYIHRRGKDILSLIANLSGNTHAGDQIVHPVQRLEKGRLAAAGGADERGDAFFGDVDADIVQRLMRAVPEVQVMRR